MINNVKAHYDNHLGNYYSRMSGDFKQQSRHFKSFCIKHQLIPQNNNNNTNKANALDLGSGHGIQTLPLAELGFHVKAIDFNKQLLSELEARKEEDNSIEIIYGDICKFKKYVNPKPELIVCCGDTLSHLSSYKEIKLLITDAYEVLSNNGKFCLTFRDYSTEPGLTNRFILVKSETDKIFSCFLEYFEQKVRVTDILYQLINNSVWQQKISSYYKTRITRNMIIDYLTEAGFKIKYDTLTKGFVTIIAKK